jgi:hypothetical protein
LCQQGGEERQQIAGEEVLGFRWVRGNEYVFEVRTTDRRTLAFDAVSGERLN